MEEKKQALLVVDVQVDFCPGGKLPVPRGDVVVAMLNRYIQLFARHNLPVFASRDWHPPQSGHFRQFGGIWPPHCIQNTPGAAFHPQLMLPPSAIVLSKGTNPNEEGYTAFQGEDDEGLLFDELLERAGIDELFVGGLATDHCVKWTVLDALAAEYKVNVLTDAVQGIDLNPGDVDRALAQMKRNGAHLVTFEQVLELIPAPV